MGVKRNPSVAGKVCIFCGSNRDVVYAHFDALGMGGDPQGLRSDGDATCGCDHLGAGTCHKAIADGELVPWRDGPRVQFTATGETARRLGVQDGVESTARWLGVDVDAIDWPMEGRLL